MKAEDLKGMDGRNVLVEAWLRATHEKVAIVNFADPVLRLADCYVPHSAIREILPHEIGVGDVVKTPGGSTVVVKAVTDEAALVQYQDGSYGGAELSDLTLIEPAQ